MKSVFTVMLLTLSLSSFAASIAESVRSVEIQKNAKCEQVGGSSFSTCFGIPKTCFYSIKYRCENAEGTFGLKLKVRKLYRMDGRGYTTSVRNTKITK